MKHLLFFIVGMLVLAGCTTQIEQSPPPVQENDQELQEMLASLIEINNPETIATIEQIAQEKDPQFIVPLVDILRFPSPTSRAAVGALQEITGEDHNRWDEWVEYVADSEDIVLPEGYLTWKGTLYSIIDPNFQFFLEDGKEQSEDFRPELAVWGGVAVAISPNIDQGIPPLEEPATIPGTEAAFMRDEDTVYGVVIQGQPRAYPQRIVDWHEMINDQINGQPFSVAYCTLCGAAIAYDTRQEDGNFHTFSSSGLLYESNKLMFDRKTQTLWNHLTGRPVLGSLVGEVEELPILSIETTQWSDWLAEHPTTDVVDINTGFNRDYSYGVPSYNRYYESAETLFPTSSIPGPLQAKDRIFGIYGDGNTKVYERTAVWEENIVNDEFNGENIVVISKGPNTGIRAYQRAEHTFSYEGSDLVDENGNVWSIDHQALSFGDERLERIPGHEAFWFGWILNFPDTEVYG